MDDSLYEVRITALLPGAGTPGQAQAAFAELFCVTMAEARQRLATLPLLVRANLSLEQAGKYQRVLSRAGMACEIRPHHPAPGPLRCSPPTAGPAPAEGHA